MTAETNPSPIGAPRADRSAVTLRRELLRLVLYAALPIVAVTLGLIAYLLATQREAQSDTVAQAARSIALAVDREAARAQTMAVTLAASPLLDRIGGSEVAMPAFENYVRRLAQTVPGLRVILLDPTGEQLVNTDAPRGAALPNLFADASAGAANATHWRRLFSDRDAQFSNLYQRAIDGKASLAYRQTVIRGDRVVGAIAVAFEAGELSAMLAREPFQQDWIVAVVDADGTIIARNREAARFVGRQASPSIRDALRVSGDNSGPLPATHLRKGTTVDGQEVFQATSRSPRSGWTIAVGAPIEVATAELARSLGV